MRSYFEGRTPNVFWRHRGLVDVHLLEGDAKTCTVTNTFVPAPAFELEAGVVAGVTNEGWTTVNLSQSFSSMVVVGSANYSVTSPPLVVRVRIATSSSFEVRVDRADGSTAPVSGVDVHYTVVNEGVYTEAEHGVKPEAVKFTSTVTDRKGSWVGESRSCTNSYTNPVVLGQVMTYNDTDFSVFWSRGASSTVPPSPTALSVGKHVGEDPDVTRLDETIGYIVVEAGAGTMGGTGFLAGLGGDSVQGVGSAPPYSYSLSGLSTAQAAIVSLAGMDGGDGGWAILYGPGAVTPATLNLAADEDQVIDLERAHTTEQVAYIVFE